VETRPTEALATLVVNKLRGGLKVASADLVTKGIIDPTKSCSSGPAECSVDRRASDHRGNHVTGRPKKDVRPPASIPASSPRTQAPAVTCSITGALQPPRRRGSRLRLGFLVEGLNLGSPWQTDLRSRVLSEPRLNKQGGPGPLSSDHECHLTPSPKSSPEPRIRNAAARTRIVSGGWLWPSRRELSCYFNTWRADGFRSSSLTTPATQSSLPQ
jgi:hypothetical protein